MPDEQELEHKRFQLISDNRRWFRKASVELRTTEMPTLPSGLFDFGYRFESCFFGNSPVDVAARYQTLEEAVAGHKQLCEDHGLNNHIVMIDGPELTAYLLKR